MPVVLVQVGGTARSGHLYDDREGVAYEYPTGRYERWIQQGDRFVYQVPRIGYTGCGVIGEISRSVDPGRLVCEVLSVRQFDIPVGLKDGSGNYFEADPAYWKKRVYWGQGVRPLSNERFDAIANAAGETIDTDSGAYADSVTSRLVEDMAVQVARESIATRFGTFVTTMPRNNPGFDLLVGDSSNPVRYVEVKGTRSSDPLFFLSEGERQFSMKYSHLYSIVIVSGIDLEKGTHSSVAIHDGAIDERNFNIRPRQWRGALRIPNEEPITND